MNVTSKVNRHFDGKLPTELLLCQEENLLRSFSNWNTRVVGHLGDSVSLLAACSYCHSRISRYMTREHSAEARQTPCIIVGFSNPGLSDTVC